MEMRDEEGMKIYPTPRAKQGSVSGIRPTRGSEPPSCSSECMSARKAR